MSTNGTERSPCARVEQLLLLVVKRGEERLARQRADIVIVLSRPVHFSLRQCGSIDAARTDNVPDRSVFRLTHEVELRAKVIRCGAARAATTAHPAQPRVIVAAQLLVDGRQRPPLDRHATALR